MRSCTTSHRPISSPRRRKSRSSNGLRASTVALSVRLTVTVTRAGQSIVAITSPKGLNVFKADWVFTAAHAMELFFPCKSYSTQFRNDDDVLDRLTYTFYGLADQTAAAAQAFEMVHNLILTWSAQNKAAKGRKGKK
jgi:hypothetical protein